MIRPLARLKDAVGSFAASREARSADLLASTCASTIGVTLLSARLNHFSLLHYLLLGNVLLFGLVNLAALAVVSAWASRRIQHIDRHLLVRLGGFDARALAVRWSRAHYLQLLAIPLMGLVDRGAFWLLAWPLGSYGVVLLGAGWSTLRLVIAARRYPPGNGQPHPDDYDRPMAADAFFTSSLEVRRGQPVKRRLYGELRNTMSLAEGDVIVRLPHPVEAGRLHLGVARLTGAPRAAGGDIRAFFDDDLVLQKSLGALPEGWQDFSALQNGRMSRAVSTIRLTSSRPAPVHISLHVASLSPERRHLIVIVLDGLRADLVGLYGGHPAMGPPLLAFAREQGGHSRELQREGGRDVAPRGVWSEVPRDPPAFLRKQEGGSGTQSPKSRSDFWGPQACPVGLHENSPTPAIDRFFGPFARYEQAYTQAEWTLPAFASMATSLYPSHHRVLNPRYDQRRRLPADHETLAEVLQRNGYYTMAYISEKRASHLYGHQRGYHRFLFPSHRPHHREITCQAIETLHAHRNENVLLFLHYFDLHSPFDLTSPLAGVGTGLMTTSDAEILERAEAGLPSAEARFYRVAYENRLREVDLFLDMLFASIERTPFRDTTAVLLTADHGMNFPTDGINDWAGKHFSEERLRIPLLIRCPWRPETHGQVYTGLVEGSIDLYPTVLDLAGVRGPVSPYAKSLLPAASGGPVGKDCCITEMMFRGQYKCRVVNATHAYLRDFNWVDGRQTETVQARGAAEPVSSQDQELIERFRGVTEQRRLFQPGEAVDAYY